MVASEEHGKLTEQIGKKSGCLWPSQHHWLYAYNIWSNQTWKPFYQMPCLENIFCLKSKLPEIKNEKVLVLILNKPVTWPLASFLTYKKMRIDNDQCQSSNPKTLTKHKHPRLCNVWDLFGSWFKQTVEKYF